MDRGGKYSTMVFGRRKLQEERKANAISSQQRLHSNQSTSLHLPLRWSLCAKEIQKGQLPNH